MTAGATSAYPKTRSPSSQWPKVRPTTPRRYAALRATSAIGRRYLPRGGLDQLGPHERPVPDPVRTVRLGAELPVAELLVLGEVPVEPAHFRVALEGEHVRRDPVEEPPIVADDDRAAGEVE